jgi:hypothetical protein
MSNSGSTAWGSIHEAFLATKPLTREVVVSALASVKCDALAAFYVTKAPSSNGNVVTRRQRIAHYEALIPEVNTPGKVRRKRRKTETAALWGVPDHLDKTGAWSGLLSTKLGGHWPRSADKPPTAGSDPRRVDQRAHHTLVHIQLGEPKQCAR